MILEATATALTDATEVATTPEVGDTTIVVTALDKRLRVSPGGTSVVRYRVTNSGDTAAVVRIKVTASRSDWAIEVIASGGDTPALAPMSIPPNDAVTVLVRITVPPNAYAGDQNTIIVEALPTDDAPA